MISPGDYKRMVLVDGDRTGIRKQTAQLVRESKVTKDEQVELGEALEAMTKTKGWTYIEAYFIRNANVSEILLEDDQTKRLEARGLIRLWNWVQNMIVLKDDLRRGANEK